MIKKLIQINKLTYSKNSNPKNCYELYHTFHFTHLNQPLKYAMLTALLTHP